MTDDDTMDHGAVPTGVRLRCSGGAVFHLDLYLLPDADGQQWVGFGPPLLAVCAPFAIEQDYLPARAKVAVALSFIGGTPAFLPVPPDLQAARW